MTVPWVCASCSRRLLYLARRQSSPWHTSRASYITFANNGKESFEEQKTDRKERPSRSPRYRRSDDEHRKWRDAQGDGPPRPARPVPTLELLDSAEDEFLQRLMKSRDNKGRGPYSKLIAEPAVVPQPSEASTRASYRPPQSTEDATNGLKPLPGHLFARKQHVSSSGYISPRQAKLSTHGEPPHQHEKALDREGRHKASTFYNDQITRQGEAKRQNKIPGQNTRPRQDKLEELFLSSARHGSEAAHPEPSLEVKSDDPPSTPNAPLLTPSAPPRGHWGAFAGETSSTTSGPSTTATEYDFAITDPVSPISSATPAKESLSRPRRIMAKTQGGNRDIYMKSVDFSSAPHKQRRRVENPPAKDIRSRLDPTAAIPRYDRDVGRAVEARDPARVRKLWSEVQAHLNTSTANSPALCSTFITAFMALQLPEKAIEVWNSMVKKGMSPGVESWDAMIKGHGLARDAKGVEDIWSRFLNSGISPDAQIWATRIHSLTISGHWHAGIAAFQEMASTWVNAIRKNTKNGEEPDFKSLGDVDGMPKPNTNVLNGLVAGLARGKKHEHLTKVFGWARTLGITMDSFTFNPILASAVRRGDGASGLQVLERMKAVGVNPDIATYTLLLQLIFRSDQGASEDPALTAGSERGRQQAVADVLKMMSDNGLDANAYVFATLVNGVLTSPYSSGEDSLAAAYMILDHMEAMQIPMSSQVYTNLLTHHFSMTPPDLAAIEALFSRARQDRRVNLDAFFFDRLIEGFARCGEVGKMTAALGHASKKNRVISWRAMTETVKALVEFGDRLRAEEITEAMRREDGNDDYRRSPTGRTTFWNTVGELGLRVEEGVATPRATESSTRALD